MRRCFCGCGAVRDSGLGRWMEQLWPEGRAFRFGYVTFAAFSFVWIFLNIVWHIYLFSYCCIFPNNVLW